ncbi:PIN domain-containing protein [Burkholderia gladioli]|uniref:PIN domain-containing protein n=1 Tax=Burkholderia gladioli TaxID=28095 RepID=UPI002FE41BD2
MTVEDIEKLKELVRHGRVRMMTVDTSIIKQHRLALGHGLLGQLAQFKDSRFSFVLSEIVVREVRRQIAESIHADLAAWPKIARRLEGMPEAADEAAALAAALGGVSPAEIAHREVDQFLIATGAEVITADHAELDRVLDLYFDGKPPFGTGNKRHEFPDAIALLGIDAWCKAANSGIIVVSTDADWLRFCENSSAGDLYVVDSLATALDIVNSTAAERDVRARERQERLVDKLRDGQLSRDVKQQLRRLLLEQARARGTSHLLAYLADIVRVDVGDVSYANPGRIRDDDAVFAAMVDMRAHCTFWANFNFYNSDMTRPMGKGMYGASQYVDAGALITAEGDTASIEVLLNKEELVIDFGEVEPDEDGVESHGPR